MDFIMTLPISSMTGAFDVSGKNIVVTGGNRGIGFGISTAFAQSGANVAILCRNITSGREAAESLKHFGGKIFAVQCDIADQAQVDAAAAKVYEEFDCVDVLVNNAGVATTTPFMDAEKGLKEWHRVIDTNLHGTAGVIHAIAPKMCDAGKGGSVINITSVGGQRVSNARTHHNSPYHASKAGLDIFTKYLAINLGDYGIRVNSIAPGPTHSDLDNDLPANYLERVKNEQPTHRFGEPIEIGALCVFLASPAGCQITGVVIPHDGGTMTYR